jgi:hypothetical protein
VKRAILNARNESALVLWWEPEERIYTVTMFLYTQSPSAIQLPALLLMVTAKDDITYSLSSYLS